MKEIRNPKVKFCHFLESLQTSETRNFPPPLWIGTAGCTGMPCTGCTGIWCAIGHMEGMNASAAADIGAMGAIDIALGTCERKRQKCQVQRNREGEIFVASLLHLVASVDYPILPAERKARMAPDMSESHWVTLSDKKCKKGIVMHSSFVEMEMGSKGSSVRTAEDFVWRKANRPNSRKRNFGVHHKTLRMLDKNYLSSKTSLRTLAWSIDKEGVHGSFANCTGYLQSNCVYSRRLPNGSWFFQLKKVQLQSPGNVLPLRALHKLKTLLGGKPFTASTHSPFTHAILWSFQVGNWASGPLWTTWRRRRCRSGWCRGTFPGPTKSPQISRTSYDVDMIHMYHINDVCILSLHNIYLYSILVV